MEVRCPACGSPARWEDNRYRPFCSDRCRLLDLGRWLREEYRVVAGEDESDSEVLPDSSSE